MRQLVRSLAVGLIERPQFKPGFAYGLIQPVCLVKLEFISSIQSIMEKIEKIIPEYLGQQTFPIIAEDRHLAKIVAKIASWYLDIQNSCGLVVHHNYRVLHLVHLETGGIRTELILPYRFVEPSLVSLQLVVKLINALASEKTSRVNIEQLVSKSKAIIKQFAEVGQNVPDILNAALVKDIPFHRINGQTYSFGFGAGRQILESTFTSKTSVVGVRLCRNKIIASQILNESGFPGGSPVRVTNSDGAVDAARHLGYPVVVKPIDTDGGVGVSAYLQTSNDVVKAYQVAREKSSEIMVDKHIEGTGHRFTIMFGNVVKVTSKLPWGVRGDGISTIFDLVARALTEQAQLDEPLAASVSTQMLDDEAMSMLQQFQLKLESVLPQDCFIPLRRRNNANAGGATVLLDFDQVHSDNLELALRVADLFLLDIAGVDLIIPDVSRSWIEQNCLVCDVNSMPQVGANAAALFLDSVMFGTDRVQVCLILHTGGASPIHQKHLRGLLGQLEIDSISSPEGIWINGKQVGRPGLNGYRTASSMFQQRDVNRAAVIMSIDEVLLNGLPCDRIQHIVTFCGNSSGTKDSRLQLHSAGSVLRDTIESDLVDSGLTTSRSEACMFMEMIWPHFVSH